MYVAPCDAQVHIKQSQLSGRGKTGGGRGPLGQGQDRRWELSPRAGAKTGGGRGPQGQNHADRLHFLEQVRLCPKAHSLVCRSAVSNPHRSGRGKAGGGRGPPGQDHADWLVTLGEQLGGLQAQMASTASTSNLHALQSQGLLPNFLF